MKIKYVDNSKCFEAFISKYQTILERKYNFLSDFEITVLEKSSSELAKYKNNPVIDKNWFYSPFMCDTSQVPSNHAEIYLVTDFCDTIVSQESRDALLLHEFGHIIFKKEQATDEETFADSIASEIIGPQLLINALNDMLKDNRLEDCKNEIMNRIGILRN